MRVILLLYANFPIQKKTQFVESINYNKVPELYIITGSNGAGKSSIGPKYLPQHIQDTCTIFDGDKLFVNKRNELWQTIKAPKEVRRLAYEYTVETFDQQVTEALAT